MRYGTNKEKNTKLGEGLRGLAKESYGRRKKKTSRSCQGHVKLITDTI